MVTPYDAHKAGEQSPEDFIQPIQKKLSHQFEDALEEVEISTNIKITDYPLDKLAEVLLIEKHLHPGDESHISWVADEDIDAITDWIGDLELEGVETVVVVSPRVLSYQKDQNFIPSIVIPVPKEGSDIDKSPDSLEKLSPIYHPRVCAWLKPEAAFLGTIKGVEDRQLFNILEEAEAAAMSKTITSFKQAISNYIKQLEAQLNHIGDMNALEEEVYSVTRGYFTYPNYVDFMMSKFFVENYMFDYTNSESERLFINILGNLSESKDGSEVLVANQILD